MTDDARPKRLLVVANETVGGTALIEAVKAHAADGPVAVRVICPQNQPKHGYIVYDETVRTAAQNRLDLTIAQLREVGIEADGEVMDPDPFAAITDAVNEGEFDAIVVSTHPETRSGWLRRGLVDRVRDSTGLTVEHVVVDLQAEEGRTCTLVVANETVAGEPLIRLLKEKAAESKHEFVVICPQAEDKPGDSAARLAATLKLLEDAGLEAVGQVMDPDPFTAIQNALDFYAIDEIVISTFPKTRSGWLRGDLIERVRESSGKPVEHVVVSADEAREGAPA